MSRPLAPKLRVELLTTINSDPSGSITAPSDGHQVVAGTALLFNGTASDDSEADLGASLARNSSTDGLIGNEKSFSTVLSPGINSFMATVSDGEGLTGSDSVTVEAVRCRSTFRM